MSHKIQTIIVLLFLMVSFQNELNSQSVLGKMKISELDSSLVKQFVQYETAILSNVDLATIDKASGGSIHLKFDKHKEIDWHINLQPVSVFTESSRVRLISTGGELMATGLSTKCYTGEIIGMAGSQVRITKTGDLFTAFIKTGHSNYFIEPLINYNKNSHRNEVIVYRQQDISDSQKMKCGQLADNNSVLEPLPVPPSSPSKVLTCKRLRLSYGLDYSIYQEFGGNLDQIIHFVSSIINLTNLDYSEILYNGFENQVSFEIQELVISTCSWCDPWKVVSDPITLLNDFRSWATSGGFSRNYDLAGFWTARSLLNGFAGFAYQGQVCNDLKYFIGRKFTDNLQSLRVMTSHEIAHTFNCFHNYERGSDCDLNPGRIPLIMDPVVDPSAVDWSDGTQLCALNSLSQLTITLENENCLDNCSNLVNCSEVSQLNIDEFSSELLIFSWEGNADMFNVKLRKRRDQFYEFETTTSDHSYVYSGNFEDCQSYYLTIESVCQESVSFSTSEIFALESSLLLDVVDVQILNCYSGESPVFDLRIDFIHTGSEGDLITLEVQGQVMEYSLNLTNEGFQSILVEGLNANGQTDEMIFMYPSNPSINGCDEVYYFDVPNGNCDLLVRENFDDCKFPYGWFQIVPITLGFYDPYEWKIADGNQPIQNYGLGMNLGKEKSLNGTCMLYMDDDVSSNPAYTGIIALFTPVYDLTQYVNISLELDYNFHNFEEAKGRANNSQFYVQVYDGANWVSVFLDEDDQCPWFDVWDITCYSRVSEDLTSYANEEFQLRFIYTDGNEGDWTGMIAIDNFILSATRVSSVLPIDNLTLVGEETIEGNLIQWVTDAEEYVEGYELEHSTDAKSFIKIHFKTAKNSIDNHYEFLDKRHVEGINYYRLKILDRNGIIEYSELIVVSNGENRKETSLLVYPNPVNDHKLFIEFNRKLNIEKVSVFTLTGTRVYQRTNIKNGNSSIMEIELNHLKPGVYILEVNASKSRYLHRVVIMN